MQVSKLILSDAKRERELPYYCVLESNVDSVNACTLYRTYVSAVCVPTCTVGYRGITCRWNNGHDEIKGSG